jgi:plastocyanin
MRHATPSRALALAAALLAGCSDTSGSNATIRLADNCDPASFDAALGAGACAHASSGSGQTFSSFNAELNANHTVAAWNMQPARLTVTEGETLPVTNTGGETHTYTEVENFGGGVVPALNTASGNPTEAPECARAATVDSSTVRPGQTMQHLFDDKGTVKYQCCIHPWMRQVVTVR